MIKEVQKLLNRPQPAQRTPEWFLARKTRVTASAVSSLLKRDRNTCERYVKLYELENEFQFNLKCCNPYSSKKQFTMNKIKQTFKGSEATFWGQKYEPVATSVYSVMTKTEVLEFGLISHETIPWLAASPDGITPEGVMLEIKCPYRRKITGIPPLYYYQQVQIQLEVCDLSECDFLEIEFMEVASLEEFVDDTLQAFNPEYKGMFLQLETTPDEYETREYFYPPDNTINNVSKSMDWKSQTTMEIIEKNELKIIENLKNLIICQTKNYRKVIIRAVYWKTVVVSNVRIRRDNEWFVNIKDRLHAEWKDACEFIDNYDEGVTLVLSEKPQETKCLF